MTSSKMENPLWKKLQNDPALLKQFNMQQNQMTNFIETGNNNNGNDANNGILQGVMTGGNANSHNGADNNSDDANDSGGGTGSNFQSMNSNKMNEFNYYQNASQSASSSVQKKNGSKLPNSNSKQQQHQQALSSYMSNFDQQNQQLQQLQQLQQYINSQSNNEQQQQYNTQHSNISNGSQSSNGYAGYYEHPNTFNNNNNKRSSPVKRELGLVEKLVGSYGFVKCLEREGRLFFHYSSFQVDQQDTGLKLGDVVEFEEVIHKRNGKPIATNISLFQQKSQDSKMTSQNQDFNMFQLNQLLSQSGQQSTNKQQSETNESNNSSDNFYSNPGQNNYNSIMNGLKMMNLQSSQAASASSAQNGAGAMNPAVMNLFNKENMYNSSNSAGSSQMNQLNMNSNLVNMFKSAAAAQQSSDLMNDSLGNLANILNLNSMSMNNMEAKKIAASNGNEQMEGSIAIVAVKRAITSQYSGRNQNYVMPQLDGRITYQRSGETFYIPYSLSDVIPASSSNSPMPNFNQSPVALKIGDRVRFFIAQALGNDINVPAGTYYARRVESITGADYNDYKPSQSMQPKQLYRGVITTLKESFGKIEREDLFKETFFHFHEYRGQNPNQELKIGLNVEFELQDRYGKEIACNIKMLPGGTVSFDELSQAVFIGRIVQPLTKVSNLIHNTNLNGINLNEVSTIGKLIYDSASANGNSSNETLTELLFSDLDRVPNSATYTLLEGDFVQFRIATDKRKKNYSNNTQMHRQPRAANVTLIEEHSLTDNSGNTGEYRERGVLVKLGTVRELVPNLDIPSQMEHFKYGAIKCVEQNELVYFSFDEVISYVRFAQENGNTSFKVKEVQLGVGDSLEFRVIKCQKDPIFKNGLQAIRVQQLTKNAVQFERISPESYTGTIEREPTVMGASANLSDKSCGLIRFEYKNGSAAPTSKTILFAPLLNESEKTWQNVGDKVHFNLSTDIKTKRQLAVNIKLMETAKEQGFITMLKENYGFIELLSKNQRNATNKGASAGTMPRDIFFHFSSVQSSMNDLDVGDEVEFKINRKTRGDQKICAEALVKLKSGSIKPMNVSSAVYKGRIVQQLRSHSLTSNANTMNSSQDQQQAAVDDVYYGKVQVSSSKKSENDTIYEFGLTSLQDKKKCFQIGELVTFQLASFQDGVKRAYNLQGQQSQSQDRASRSNDLKRGKIDSIKGHCGFIEYAINANNDMKKVFFHISDLTEGYTNVKSDPSCIQIGEEVEFTLMHNSRSGKYSAIKIKKLNGSKSAGTNGNTSALHHSSSNGKDLSEQTEGAQPVAKRPEHLITKLKIGNVDDASGKRLVLIRQPGKPDGKSFSRRVFERLPGSFEEIKRPEPVATEPTTGAEQADTEVSGTNGADVVVESADSNADQSSTISIMNLIIANESTEN